MNNNEILKKAIVKTEENLKIISETRRIVGYDGFSEEGKAKIAALEFVRKCLTFSDTLGDFLTNIEELKTSEDTRKLARKFAKHGLKLEEVA
jgi:predicted polyphosphate/ATP-dependent NAD kinase